jgi:very-short-patch-repair endonuclease
MRQTTRKTVAKARELRREMSPAEIKLWQVLRSRPQNLKFRHQHPMGPFVADFYCAARKLIVEVDGVTHDMGNNPARDARRDAWMQQRGYRIVRVRAAEVMADVEAVLLHILE